MTRDLPRGNNNFGTVGVTAKFQKVADTRLKIVLTICPVKCLVAK